MYTEKPVKYIGKCYLNKHLYNASTLCRMIKDKGTLIEDNVVESLKYKLFKWKVNVEAEQLSSLQLEVSSQNTDLHVIKIYHSF